MRTSRYAASDRRRATGRPRLSREHALVRVLACIERSEYAPMVLSEIYAAAGVSPRTLRTMFDDIFGMTPRRYLRLRRLHQLRTALLMTDAPLRPRRKGNHADDQHQTVH